LKPHFTGVSPTTNQSLNYLESDNK